MHAHATLALLWTFGGAVAWYLPWLLGRFLVGFVAGAQHWFDGDGVDHARLFRRMLVVGAIGTAIRLGLDTAWMLQVFSLSSFGLPGAIVEAVITELGLLCEVGLYVAIVVALMQRPMWRRLLSVVAPVGRMPLSTYLMQSAISTSLFYGWGLNWSTPPPAQSVVLGLAIFVVQIVIAHLWLRWFRFGPAEWLWRTVVYWKRQPMWSPLSGE
jgi:uncharacterized protein